MKGYIYNLDSQAKISVPKDDKETLGLIQPFLVLQIYIPMGKNLHIEVGLTDAAKVSFSIANLNFVYRAKDV